MLTELHIRDVVLIDQLVLKFDQGMTALTGETGAGKSILLDAMGLVLGARGDTSLVRKGAERLSVTALFALPASKPDHKNAYGHRKALLELMREYDIPQVNGDMINDGDMEVLIKAGFDLTIRRSLSIDGRGKAYINDTIVSVSTLRLFGGYLIDIHGQFDTHSLLAAPKQREALNAFGGLQKQALEVADLFQDWKQAQTALNEAQKALYDIQREELWLRDCVEELDALSPYEGQEAEIFEQRTKLASRETFVRAYSEACAALSGEASGYDSGAGSASALVAMNDAMNALEKIADKAESDVRPLLDRMDQCYQEIRDLNDTVADQLHAIDHDAASLDELETTLHQIRRLSRKHHCADGDALVALHEDLRGRLDLMDHSDARIEALEKQCAEKKDAYLEKAKQLLEKQQKSGQSLKKDIEAELPPLKLGNAAFEVTFDEREEEQWSAEGIARIGFSVRMNAGGHFGALDKVASGGELSRIMLALKVVLTKVRVMPVMIFDEIDSGMGGQTAHALGERLKRLSEDCQLLCITHAPQVAACADMHMVVSKDDVKGNTRTQVNALQNVQEQRAEIARMLSGADITDEAMAAAKSLMDKAA